MNRFKKLLMVLICVSAACSISYAFGMMCLNRIAWGLADKFVKGMSRIEERIALDKIASFGNYQHHLEIMLDKMDRMSFEEFKLEEKRRLCLEIRIASTASSIIESYLEYHRKDR